MLLGDEVVGAISIFRTSVAPFSDREMELLDEFAAQAAVALRQVDLMASLEQRSTELASKVEQLEGLGELGEAVSSSLDPDEVLERIVTSAVRLAGTDGGSIMEYDDQADAFVVRAAHGTSTELLDTLRQLTIHRRSTLVGRAATERRPLAVPDLQAAADLDPHLAALLADGWRSLLAIPMLRADLVVGVLNVRRRSPGGFPDDMVDVLQTFASQSSVAIVNARLFRELETKSAELEVASRHKSEFLASMSHELRTPLNAVIGFSEVLLDRMFGELNDRQDEYVRDIWNSGRHLLELLNEVLDLSKVEAGQMTLEPATFRVADVLDHALSLVRERATAHGIALGLHVHDEVGSVHADELRFKQVVLNLLSNAVKFTPDGGRVDVEARTVADELVVTVTDTGVGVPPEDRERIFESFQQGGRGARPGGRHRARPHPVAPDRRALRRAPLARVRDGVGKHLRVRHPRAPTGSARSDVRAGRRIGPDRPHRRRRPCLGGPDVGLPVRIGGPRRAGRGRRPGGRADPESPPSGRPARHQAPATRRLAGAGRPQGRPGDRTGAGRRGLGGRRTRARTRAGRRGLPHQTGQSRRSAPGPRGRRAPAGAASAGSRTGADVSSGRILVVEDNPLNLKLVRDVLDATGYDVVEATSGEEGLRLAAEAPPDLVLLDLQLPGIDGLETLQRLRDGVLAPDVPVMALTAFAMDEDRARARAVGFDAYVTKPISVKGLLGQVARLIETGRDG